MTEAPNRYAARIAQLSRDLALIREERGDILLALDKAPNDKSLEKRVKELDAEITRAEAAIAAQRDLAGALTRAHTKAAVAASAEARAAARAALEAEEAGRAADAEKIDQTIAELLRRLASYDAHTTAAFAAGRQLEIPGGTLRQLLDLSPLGVALADAIARNGWTRLPFMEVAHPRNPASCAALTAFQSKKLLAHADKALGTGKKPGQPTAAEVAARAAGKPA